MEILPLILALVAVAQPLRAAIFEAEIWPGEGRPVFEATGKSLTLYARPSRGAKQLGVVTPRAGQPITFDETRYRTIRAGRFRVIRPTTIAGRILGPLRSLSRDEYYFGNFPFETITVAMGATVQFLQYRAEGACFVRFGANVIDADPCPTRDAAAFRLELEPTVEWWIHTTSMGIRNGWLLVDNRVVKFLDREF